MSQGGILQDKTTALADVEFLTGDVGGPVGPDGLNNINLLTGPGLISTGDPITNTITFSVQGSGFDWEEKNTNFNAQVSFGYFVTNTATATLPTAVIGDTITFASDTTNLLTIQTAANQYIRLGNSLTAINGNIVSTSRGDSITLVYRASTLTWIATSVIGNWTIN